MHLVIVSGMSGAGKSLVLHTLEDQGYYCIDNLPLELLDSVLDTRNLRSKWKKIAIGIDVRSGDGHLEQLPYIVSNIKQNFNTEIIYLYADNSILLKRYDETRRKHPLTNGLTPLKQAINDEYQQLAPVREIADIQIDTSNTDIYELASKIKNRVCDTDQQTLSLMFQSFGFKYGTPRDSDYLFDVRCLPNPYWVPGLRNYSGRDNEVIAWLESQPAVQDMEKDLIHFFESWIPKIIQSQRAYLTISVGCTGGHHRSVYLVEKLATHFKKHYPEAVMTSHRELD